MRLCSRVELFSLVAKCCWEWSLDLPTKYCWGLSPRREEFFILQRGVFRLDGIQALSALLLTIPSANDHPGGTIFKCRVPKGLLSKGHLRLQFLGIEMGFFVFQGEVGM